MIKTNNPAGRLHILLSEARATSTPNQSRIVWEQVLRAKENSDDSMIARFLQLRGLYRDTRVAIEGIQGINKELYLGEMHRIENLLFVETLFRPWNQVRENLNDTVMQALAFSAERLSELPQYREPGDDQIAALLNEIDSLIEHLCDSPLEPRIQDVLLKILNKLRNALVEYRIRGTTRLLEALEETTGIMIVNWEVIKNHEPEKAVTSVGKLWKQFTDLVTLAVGVQQLAPPAIELLHRLLNP